MSNLLNLQRVVIQVTSGSHHVTQIKHKNRHGDTCFCKESFIDRSFLVFKFLKGGRGRYFVLHKSKKPIVNMVFYDGFYMIGASLMKELELVSLILQLCSINTDAVFRRCSEKMMFLKFSQNSKERTCVRVSL